MPLKTIQSDEIRLRHMLDACQEALSFVNEKTYQDLEKDRKLTLSLIKEIEIIGEAAYGISDAFKKKYSQIPWSIIIGARHRLVHGYFDIDLTIVWKTITEDLPFLVKQLQDLLAILEKTT